MAFFDMGWDGVAGLDEAWRGHGAAGQKQSLGCESEVGWCLTLEALVLTGDGVRQGKEVEEKENTKPDRTVSRKVVVGSLINGDTGAKEGATLVSVHISA